MNTLHVFEYAEPIAQQPYLVKYLACVAPFVAKDARLDATAVRGSSS